MLPNTLKPGDWFVNPRFNSESVLAWKVIKIKNDKVTYKTFNLKTREWWHNGETRESVRDLSGVIILDEETKSRLL
jgi:hypothetical protein